MRLSSSDFTCFVWSDIRVPTMHEIIYSHYTTGQADRISDDTHQLISVIVLFFLKVHARCAFVL